MPNDKILGIPSKACINGISKEEVDIIKAIPDVYDEVILGFIGVQNAIGNIDNRVSELEQHGGSDHGLQWIDANYQTGSNIDYLNFFDGYTTFTTDVILYYHSTVTDPNIANDRTGYLYIPKGSHVETTVFTINILRNYMDNTTGKTYFEIGYAYATGDQLRRLVTKNTQYGESIFDNLSLMRRIVQFNITDNTMRTYNDAEFKIRPENNILSLFYKGQQIMEE